jgi:hypothetical protein
MRVISPVARSNHLFVPITLVLTAFAKGDFSKIKSRVIVLYGTEKKTTLFLVWAQGARNLWERGFLSEFKKYYDASYFSEINLI